VTARAAPVAAFFSVIRTFGIASCEALVTVPEIVPPATCA
jgi:hypothetical protein